MSKRKIILFIVFLIILLVILGVFIYSTRFREEKLPPYSQEETATANQLKELEELRKNTSVPSPTEEEKEQQLKELDALRGTPKPLTQDEARKQLEELNNLRQ
jgi:uncharacterized protein YpmB